MGRILLLGLPFQINLNRNQLPLRTAVHRAHDPCTGGGEANFRMSLVGKDRLSQPNLITFTHRHGGAQANVIVSYYRHGTRRRP